MVHSTTHCENGAYVYLVSVSFCRFNCIFNFEDVSNSEDKIEADRHYS